MKYYKFLFCALFSCAFFPFVSTAEPNTSEEKTSIDSENIDVIANATVLIKTADGIGSGFFINKDGLIVTNYHVIAGAKRLLVETRDGRKEVITRIPVYKNLFAKDIVLLKVSLPSPSYLTLAKNKPNLNDSVLVVGHPYGHTWTLTKGYVAGFRREGSRHVLQTSATISPGNSGGPICNTSGEVLAVASYLERQPIVWSGGAITYDKSEVLKFGVSVQEIADSLDDSADHPYFDLSEVVALRQYGESLARFGALLFLTDQLLSESRDLMKKLSVAKRYRNLSRRVLVNVQNPGSNFFHTEYRTKTEQVIRYGINIEEPGAVFQFLYFLKKEDIADVLGIEIKEKSLRNAIMSWEKAIGNENKLWEDLREYEVGSPIDAKFKIREAPKENFQSKKNLYISTTWIRYGLSKYGAYSSQAIRIYPKIRRLELLYKKAGMK